MNRTLELLKASKVVYCTALDEGAAKRTIEAIAAGAEAVMYIYSANKGVMLKELLDEFKNGVIAGAGEITSADTAFEAVEAGARFICAPLPMPEIYKTCLNLDVPVIGEAATANEARTAQKCGAAAIKIFPSAELGAPYFGVILKKVPCPFAAAGGITEINAKSFLQAGASLLFVEDDLSCEQLRELIKQAHN